LPVGYSPFVTTVTLMRMRLVSSASFADSSLGCARCACAVARKDAARTAGRYVALKVW